MRISVNLTSAFNCHSTNYSGDCNFDSRSNRMGDRAVYCARLESVCAERHPGFESPPIRQCFHYSCLSLLLVLVRSLCLGCRPIAFLQHLNLLPKLDHAALGKDAAKVYARINHAIAPQERARIDNRIATNFRSVADDRAEFCEAGCDIVIGRHDGDFAVIEFYVRENHACAKMSVVTED